MIIPVGFSNVRFIFAVSGVVDQMGFSLGILADDLVTPTEIADFCYDDFKGAFFDTTAQMFTSWTFVGTSCSKSQVAGPLIGEHLQPVVGTGTVGSPSVNTAVLVRKQTALGGRRHRGRMFVPPFNLPEDDIQVSGQLGLIYQAAQQTRWNAFFTALAADNLEPHLYHSHPDDLPTSITSFAVQSLAATQRRRMR